MSGLVKANTFLWTHPLRVRIKRSIQRQEGRGSSLLLLNVGWLPQIVRALPCPADTLYTSSPIVIAVLDTLRILIRRCSLASLKGGRQPTGWLNFLWVDEPPYSGEQQHRLAVSKDKCRSVLLNPTAAPWMCVPPFLRVKRIPQNVHIHRESVDGQLT